MLPYAQFFRGGTRSAVSGLLQVTSRREMPDDHAYGTRSFWKGELHFYRV